MTFDDDVEIDEVEGHEADQIPEHAWVLHRWAAGLPAAIESQSSFFGLAGLGLLLVVAGVVATIEVFIVDTVFTSRVSEWLVLFIFQLILLPPIMVFSFAVVASLLRSGSLLKNFSIALALTSPGPAVFLLSMSLVIKGFDRDNINAVVIVLFAYYIAAAVVATICQFWTRWRLDGVNLSNRPSKRPGIQALIELTGVSAVLIACAMSIEVEGLLTGTLIFVALGLLSSCATISFLIGFLGGKMPAKVIAMTLIYAAAFTLCAFVALGDFRLPLTLSNTVFAATSAIPGSVILLITMAACTWWLKVCGWQCTK